MSQNKEYFFSHDSNARGDLKIIKLRRELGWAGYGVYWCIIEMLRVENEHKLSFDDIDNIAYELDYDIPNLERIIRDFGLFVLDGDYFYSRRLTASMNALATFKEKMSKAGKKGMKSRYSKAKTKDNGTDKKMVL